MALAKEAKLAFANIESMKDRVVQLANTGWNRHPLVMDVAPDTEIEKARISKKRPLAAFR